jgi:hypothetical protein
VVRGAAGYFRHHTRKTQRCQIQLVDEGVDNSDRIAFGHVVVKTVRGQCYLTTVTTFDKSGHPNLQDFVPDSIKQLAFSHSLGGYPTWGWNRALAASFNDIEVAPHR